MPDPVHLGRGRVLALDSVSVVSNGGFKGLGLNSMRDPVHL
jgi:hypothetical protein